MTSDGAGPKFLLPAELARVCDVTPKTIAEWAKSGRLKAARSPGGRLRILLEDATSFLKAHGYPVPQEWMSP